MNSDLCDSGGHMILVIHIITKSSCKFSNERELNFELIY